jgi:hypothetical protein
MYSSSWKHGHRDDETLRRHRQCKEAQFSAALEIEVSCGVFCVQHRKTNTAPFLGVQFFMIHGYFISIFHQLEVP